VPLEDVAAMIDGGLLAERLQSAVYDRARGSPAGRPVPAASLLGVYPNHVAEGIGRGHLFALHLLLQAQLVATKIATASNV